MYHISDEYDYHESNAIMYHFSDMLACHMQFLAKESDDDDDPSHLKAATPDLPSPFIHIAKHVSTSLPLRRCSNNTSPPCKLPNEVIAIAVDEEVAHPAAEDETTKAGPVEPADCEASSTAYGTATAPLAYPPNNSK